jgi:hypothetical protein
MTNATAAEIVADPNLVIDPITAETSSKRGYSDKEIAHFRLGHDDIKDIIVRIHSFGRKNTTKKNLRHFITDAVFEDSIDSTPTFTLSIHDPDWELLNTGALDEVIDVNPGKIPHRWYRLGQFSVQDDDITLTFLTRNAVYLTSRKRPHKSNRKKVTRAQFILGLVREIKKTKIKFFCPQLEKRQKTATTRFGSDTERKKHRAKGFDQSDHIKVKNKPATQLQLGVIEKVIQAGEDKHAPSLVIVAAVMTITQETEAGANTANKKYIGVFQQDARYWAATGDPYKDAVGANGKQGFYDAAIRIYKGNPDQSLEDLILQVQKPGYSLYGLEVAKWRRDAQHAVSSWGIVVGGTITNTEFKKKYEFMVGPPDGDVNENYLAAIYRLAEEVRWRAFWVNDVLHYQSEDELYAAKARRRLRRYEDGIEHVNFDWNQVRAPLGDPRQINTMTLQVRMERWVMPLGTVVIFDEGGPAQGRWLVTNIRRSVFDELGEITLSKPIGPKAEPANDPGSREPTTPGGGPGAPTSDDVTDVLGTLADVKSSMTAKQVIDRFVIPKAKFWGMTDGISPQQVVDDNARHHGTEATSMHKGNGVMQWAVDMSTGSRHPDDAKDNLASDLIMSFNLNPLADPLATEKDGYVNGNLTNTYNKGFKWQLIYRTNLGAAGGNHYNHVHLGLRKESAPRPH